MTEPMLAQDNSDWVLAFLESVDCTTPLHQIYSYLLEKICVQAQCAQAFLALSDASKWWEVFAYTLENSVGEWVDIQKTNRYTKRTFSGQYDHSSPLEIADIFPTATYTSIPFKAEFAQSAWLILPVSHAAKSIPLLGRLCSHLLTQKSIYYYGLATECKARGAKTLSTMIHDIRNPLSGVTGFAQLLKRKLTDAKQIEYSEIILTTLRRIEQTASEPVRFVRGDSAEVEMVACNVDEILATTLDGMSQSSTMQHVRVFSRLESGASIQFVPEWLKRIISALMENATVSIAEKGEISVSSHRFETRVEIVIQDSGKGIPIMVRNHVVKPLFAFDKEKSAGLGLAMVSYMAKVGGGTVQVSSVPCYGTRCVLSFPLGL